VISCSKNFLAGVILLLLVPSLWSQPKTRLKPETLQAFEKYVSKFEVQIEESVNKGASTFWVEKLDPADREAIRKGRIRIENTENVPEISDGIVHDWWGAVFVPGVKAEDALELLLDYDRHQEIYPEAVQSRTLEKGPDTTKGYLLFRKEKVLTVILATEHEARTRQLNENHWYIVSHSTKVAEVKDYGTPQEEELPVDEGSGFMWRLNAYWSILQEDDGVLLECGTISLSRNIPWGLGWVIRPFVESLPRETLEETLQATRMALVNSMEGSN
jgi:hypothetical protein